MSVGSDNNGVGVQFGRKVEFHTELNITPLHTDGTYWRRWVTPRLYRLNGDMEFTFYGQRYTIPAGFICDFASVPRPMKWWFPDDIITGYAALVHDFLYRTGCVPKAVADAVFYDLLIEQDEAPVIVAKLMFKGVEWFGGPAWRENRRRQTATSWPPA